MTSPILDRLEAYYDAVPRSGARAEDFGPLTLFVRDGGAGYPYYARPARGFSGPVQASDVDRVRARQRQLGLPESFEWVAGTTPALRAAVERSGRTLVAAAVVDGSVLGSGQHQPVGAVSEIVGVGTLPSARRQGLAAAVTAELVRDAGARRGVATVFLSAGDEDIARLYARLGFRRVGTALIAEPPC
ncbi:GNAT family N-acetyltransferase [Streptomyces sp. NPDC052396]|uniref:GNAT family N-acetyltransferase n=1 Tax=Streptomyces sp. NPDC052396 TaxID=3365689 RepID=UPI0037D96F83